jgi:hypothetical protein
MDRPIYEENREELQMAGIIFVLFKSSPDPAGHMAKMHKQVASYFSTGRLIFFNIDMTSPSSISGKL